MSTVVPNVLLFKYSSFGNSAVFSHAMANTPHTLELLRGTSFSLERGKASPTETDGGRIKQGAGRSDNDGNNKIMLLI